VENDGPSKNRGWNLQDWKMTDEIAGVEFAGLENDGRSRRVEFAGLENDGRSRRGGICRTEK